MVEILRTAVRQAISKVSRLRDIDQVIEELSQNEQVDKVTLLNVDLGTGSTTIEMSAKEVLFYEALEDLTGFDIRGSHHLFKYMVELSKVKREYDKVAAGLQEVRNTGYGLVSPTVEDMELAEPQLIKQGGRLVKLSNSTVHSRSEPTFLRKSHASLVPKSNVKI